MPPVVGILLIMAIVYGIIHFTPDFRILGLDSKLSHGILLLGGGMVYISIVCSFGLVALFLLAKNKLGAAEFFARLDSRKNQFILPGSPDTGEGYATLAVVLLYRCKYEEALQMARKSVAIAELQQQKRLAFKPQNAAQERIHKVAGSSQHEQNPSFCRGVLARVLIEFAEYDEALSLCKTNLKFYEEQLARAGSPAAQTLITDGVELHDPQMALAQAGNKAIDKLSSTHYLKVSLNTVLLTMARIYRETNQSEQAMSLLNRAERARSDEPQEKRGDLCEIWIEMAFNHLALGAPKQASDCLKHASEILATKTNLDDILLKADVMVATAAIAAARGDQKAAQESLNEALALRKKYEGESSRGIANIMMRQSTLRAIK